MLTNIEAERARLQLTKEDISRELGITSKTYLAYIRGKPIPSNVRNYSVTSEKRP